MGITIIGLAELQARLLLMPGAIGDAVLAKTQALSDALTEKVKDKLSGEVLNAKSGALRDSINSGTEQAGSSTSANVFVDGDIPYAAIQEYGGTTKSYIIEAVNAKALAFRWQGRDAFYKSVMHPASVIPERSYLRSSLDDMNDEITQGFGDALNDAFNEVFNS